MDLKEFMSVRRAYNAVRQSVPSEGRLTFEEFAILCRLDFAGVPMKTSDLGGVDSLYSIVQMPSGIPVATVAINGGANAGILAAKILATSDAELLSRLKAYSQDLKEQVEKKDARLQEVGYKNY